MKIAYIRSVELKQAHPYVADLSEFARERGLALKLFYTDGECTSQLFPGESEKVSPDISVQYLVSAIVDWGAERVFSLSIPDNNSLRDACVRQGLEERHAIPAIMHSVAATHTMS